MSDLQLGLIGDNIAASRSPLLHRLAGAQNNQQVRYDRLVPAQMDKPFKAVFAYARDAGFRGLNITYPYKEQVVPMVRIDDPLLRQLGAVNTVIFDAQGPVGYNTDYTGFMAAYRQSRADAAPGTALMIGTGGVGRAVAFGLLALGAKAIRLLDRDPAKAQSLAAALRAAAPNVTVTVHSNAQEAAAGADGVINCTPVGMVGHPGTPLPKAAMAGASWAFDAVYTPPDTEFLQSAQEQGLVIISGWALFFYQGVQAWGHFTGLPLDEARLRADLLNPELTA
ncbi:shikimate dehydrogenase [Thioclava sp. SK-1]|uniref:shikimate dehydrogenase family protein n=1 Tax=Thioclava sp. SK-1 TaxID=1889770 RepID=UPI000825AAB1|nr:shikimate dehydrogenase [Thioclava sp. SK-1]OCX67336.1 shikimate dehydrogenase [Thioclava sp. SK-1]